MGNCCSVQCSFENFLLRGWDFIVGHANYVCRFQHTLPTISAALQELSAQRNDLLRQVDLAEQRLSKPFEQVQLWLSKAETMITEAEKLIADGPQQLNNLCLGGCASKMSKMLQEISDHKSKGAFGKVAENQPAASVVVMPVEQPVALESTIQKVWSCIEDEDVGIIGLYGLGGALVSKDYDVGKIQDRIGGNLGFSDDSWKNKSVEEKAVDIYGVLLNKKFVVLLDDLWKRVDLKQVETPQPSQTKGSKLIFTTRSLGAWELFQDKVGDAALNSHPDIPNLAKQVAERCGGLPLALITIGHAMACKTTLEDWKYAIEMLKRFALPKLENEVFPLLKFSYDNLPDATMKCCLLYCYLHPEDYCIPKKRDYCIPKKRLVEYWFCEGLLNKFDRISEAQMQGGDIISSFLNACLLERDGEDCVKVLDVICDMGLWITREFEATEYNFFVKAGAQLFEEPDAKEWESAKRMSVMKNKIKVLKETPKCPNLRILFLSENEFQVISDECFDLSFTGIEELPIELKSWTKLKMLDLSCMDNLRKIPQHLICSFSKLQIFRMWFRMYLIDYPNEDNELKGLQHLNILRISIHNMVCLERFLSFNLFRCCTEALELSDFRESNVFNVLCLENLERLKKLQFCDCEIMEEIKMEKLHTLVSKETSCFHTLSEVIIMGCKKLKDVTWLMLAPNLRTLWITGCAKMEEILSEGKLSEVAGVIGIPYSKPFLKLETLHLFDLAKLKSMYWDALPFPCLKLLHLHGCRELKKLPLNSDSAKGNRLSIEGSKDWWAAIEWENEATRNAFLPSFKSVCA
ncbi:hypothetical protein E1A91_D06G233800v1 [Gossypium mustelinum]|uniref:NB-ARC domain-containing protein n=1 Tax=Gossypium mustelinum TaxID=34275 RepID=A0A5D2ULZ9_GOSMU|nr:hypothetical protein E1A91_D06G233800v1 [Gossypium mustelinum]